MIIFSKQNGFIAIRENDAENLTTHNSVFLISENANTHTYTCTYTHAHAHTHTHTYKLSIPSTCIVHALLHCILSWTHWSFSWWFFDHVTLVTDACFTDPAYSVFDRTLWTWDYKFHVFAFENLPINGLSSSCVSALKSIFWLQLFWLEHQQLAYVVEPGPRAK